MKLVYTCSLIFENKLKWLLLHYIEDNNNIEYVCKSSNHKADVLSCYGVSTVVQYFLVGGMGRSLMLHLFYSYNNSFNK